MVVAGDERRVDRLPAFDQHQQPVLLRQIDQIRHLGVLAVPRLADPLHLSRPRGGFLLAVELKEHVLPLPERMRLGRRQIPIQLRPRHCLAAEVPGFDRLHPWRQQ